MKLLPLLVKVSIFLVTFVVVIPFSYAKVIAGVSHNNIIVILHDEPCTLKSQVSNLPRRAVWTENNEAIEGCWGADSHHGLILMFFADRAVIATPMQDFIAVQSF